MRITGFAIIGALVLALGCGDSTVVISSGSPPTTRPATSSESVDPDQMPYTVRQAIQRSYRGATIKSLHLITINQTGESHYQAELQTVTDQQVKVDVTRQGKIIARY
jgi:hypothetical protein